MIELLRQYLGITTWFDLLLYVLDIVIVYYLIYRVLLLIKGTKAVQMLIGLIFIIIFFVASKEDYLNLPTLNWMLDKFISAFILIIVVIFQDDIRRGLTQVGRTSLFSNLTSREETHVLEEVIKASSMLSSRKIGGLIAIEREADLTDYTTEGIEIGARVSKELLFSIFVPTSQNPLHDGAVIIRDDKVLSAACFLPLTNNPSVEKSLGTRHRAAIGLSEETDAAVVVVSEETGTISLAFREEMIRGLDTSKLRDLLHKIFSYPGSVSSEQERLSALQWLRQSLQRNSSSSRRRGRRRKRGPSTGEHRPVRVTGEHSPVPKKKDASQRSEEGAKS